MNKLNMGHSTPEMETDWPALAAVPQQALKVKRLHTDAVMPQYATDGSACFDLCSIGSDYVPHGASRTFRTGLSFEIPPGHVMLVFSRSGHGFKNGIRLGNCVGVIDADYRGEVMVKLASDNHNPMLTAHKTLFVHPGDRIAQAMLVPIPRVQLVEVDDLTDTERGAGGFGSTGA